MCMRRQNQDDDTTGLDYRHSNLNDVPSDVFTHERTLEELRLDCNHIRDLPRVCDQCNLLINGTYCSIYAHFYSQHFYA